MSTSTPTTPSTAWQISDLLALPITALLHLSKLLPSPSQSTAYQIAFTGKVSPPQYRCEHCQDFAQPRSHPQPNALPPCIVDIPSTTTSTNNLPGGGKPPLPFTCSHCAYHKHRSCFLNNVHSGWDVDIARPLHTSMKGWFSSPEWMDSGRRELKDLERKGMLEDLCWDLNEAGVGKEGVLRRREWERERVGVTERVNGRSGGRGNAQAETQQAIATGLGRKTNNSAAVALTSATPLMGMPAQYLGLGQGQEQGQASSQARPTASSRAGPSTQQGRARAPQPEDTITWTGGMGTGRDFSSTSSTSTPKPNKPNRQAGAFAGAATGPGPASSSTSGQQGSRQTQHSNNQQRRHRSPSFEILNEPPAASGPSNLGRINPTAVRHSSKIKNNHTHNPYSDQPAQARSSAHNSTSGTSTSQASLPNLDQIRRRKRVIISPTPSVEAMDVDEEEVGGGVNSAAVAGGSAQLIEAGRVNLTGQAGDIESDIDIDIDIDLTASNRSSPDPLALPGSARSPARQAKIPTPVSKKVASDSSLTSLDSPMEEDKDDDDESEGLGSDTDGDDESVVFVGTNGVGEGIVRKSTGTGRRNGKGKGRAEFDVREARGNVSSRRNLRSANRLNHSQHDVTPTASSRTITRRTGRGLRERSIGRENETNQAGPSRLRNDTSAMQTGIRSGDSRTPNGSDLGYNPQSHRYSNRLVQRALQEQVRQASLDLAEPIHSGNGLLPRGMARGLVHSGNGLLTRGMARGLGSSRRTGSNLNIGHDRLGSPISHRKSFEALPNQENNRVLPAPDGRATGRNAPPTPTKNQTHVPSRALRSLTSPAKLEFAQGAASGSRALPFGGAGGDAAKPSEFHSTHVSFDSTLTSLSELSDEDEQVDHQAQVINPLRKARKANKSATKNATVASSRVYPELPASFLDLLAMQDSSVQQHLFVDDQNRVKWKGRGLERIEDLVSQMEDTYERVAKQMVDGKLAGYDRYGQQRVTPDGNVENLLYTKPMFNFPSKQYM